MPHIIIRRKKEYIKYFSSFKVYLNDEYTGSIANDETIRRIAEQGRNTIRIRMEWCGSPETEFIAEDDTIRTFEIQLRELPWFLNLFMMLLIFAFVIYPPGFLDVSWYFQMALVISAILLLIYQFTLGRDRFLEITEVQSDPKIYG